MNKEEFLRRMNNPNIYLHITKDLNHNGKFFIRIPEDRLIGWNEDSKTPRIYVAEDLNGCLKRASNICGVDYTDLPIATSDMFASNYNLSNSIRREYNAACVDCETGSVGEYCFINDISYAAVKVIANFANNNAIKQHNLYNEESSNICQRIIYKFLKEFYDA